MNFKGFEIQYHEKEKKKTKKKNGDKATKEED
jgi:hypothetical protein